MTGLIIVSVLILAAIYGLFFIIFKLIALLCKKQGYKIPLISAGIATLLVSILTGLAIYRLYQKFITPFQPIIQAIQTHNTPIYGQNLYVDPTYGFSVTQYNGTVFSQWIRIAQAEVLMGVDINSFINQSAQNQNKTFTAFSLIRTEVPPNTTAEQLMQNLLPQLENSDETFQIYLQDPELIALGDQNTGSFVSAVIYADQQLPPTGLPVALLIAVQDRQAYYFVGISNQEDDILWNTLTSFRLPL